MIPVPGFEDLRIRWVEIHDRGFILYGFIMYSDADQHIIDFMEVGLPLLDKWSGPETAIFVFEQPNQAWVRYVASQPDHPWHLFESSAASAELTMTDEPISLLIREADTILLDTGNEQVSLRRVLDPSYTRPYDRLEVERVRQYFGLALDQYPCIIFFEDLNGRDFCRVPMSRFRDVQDVRHWFQVLFMSTAFKDLIERVRPKVKSNV